MQEDTQSLIQTKDTALASCRKECEELKNTLAVSYRNCSDERAAHQNTRERAAELDRAGHELKELLQSEKLDIEKLSAEKIRSPRESRKCADFPGYCS